MFQYFYPLLNLKLQQKICEQTILTQVNFHLDYTRYQNNSNTRYSLHDSNILTKILPCNNTIHPRSTNFTNTIYQDSLYAIQCARKGNNLSSYIHYQELDHSTSSRQEKKGKLYVLDKIIHLRTISYNNRIQNFSKLYKTRRNLQE